MQDRIRVLAASVVLALSGVSLVGWSLDSLWLAGGIPALPAMNPNAAAAFLLLGAAQLAGVPGRTERLRLGAWVVAATLAGILSSAAISAYLGGIGSALDALLFLDTSIPGAAPRMTPQSAIGLTLLAAAMLQMGLLPRPGVTVALTAAAAVLGSMALIGYLYGADQLLQPFGVGATSPAVALGLILSALSLGLSAVPDRLMAPLTVMPSALLLRRVLPLSLAVLVVVGYLMVLGESYGIFDREAETAATVVLSGTLLTVLLTHTATTLYRYALAVDAARIENERANELLKQLALELNDNVVQHLSAAWLANNAEDADLAGEELRLATSQAQRIASELLTDRRRGGTLKPGDLVRTQHFSP